MTPDEYTEHCLRTWHQGDAETLQHRWSLELQAGLEELGKHSLRLEHLKKEAIMGRPTQPLDRQEWMEIRCASHDRRAEACLSPQAFRRLHALMGLGGEWQEVLRAETRDQMVGELGDMLYYLTISAHEWGIPLKDVMEHNVQKLQARYPEGAPK